MKMTARVHALERHWFAVSGVFMLMLLLVYAIVLRGPQAVDERPVALQIQAMPNATGEMSALSRDGGALLLEGDQGADSRAEVLFTLPRREPESPHWVLWIRRVPLQTLQVHAGDAWVASERSFLRPAPDDGLLPVGYIYRLPSTWEGEIRLELDAKPLRMASLRPEVISESLADRYMQRATIITTVIYCSLSTLALLSLALFFAARDWSFLSFFGFCTAAVFQIAAYNGHLYLLDGLGVFAWLDSAGLNAMTLIFEAAALRILKRYADLGVIRPEWAKAINTACVGLLLLAVVIIAWGPRSAPIAVWAMPLLWAAGGIVSLGVIGDAWRRRLPMAGLVLLSVLGVVAAIVISEMAGAGLIVGTLWTHYGYQIAIMACAAMIGVGLISRIAKYREQRDREQRARQDSEQRLYREAVRSELLTALQANLRGMAEEEIQPLAYRLLLEHLRRIVPIDTALIMARGYQGHDTMVSVPSNALDQLIEQASPRLQALRQQLAASVELQRPVTKPGNDVPVAIEAAVSLPVRAPAWGAIVLERSGATVFHPEELAIARELARITITQIDEAVVALKLRHTAEIDALTGSLNRRSIDQALARCFQQAHRSAQPVSVLFADIDHFKTFNDLLGHACGDHCLRELAQALRSAIGDDDIFGRYGGEEFVMILPGRQTEMARAIAEELRVAVEATEILWNDRILHVTVSIGVATRLDNESLPQPALERADRALYAAKRAGRNRVHVAPAIFQARPTTA